MGPCVRVKQVGQNHSQSLAGSILGLQRSVMSLADFCSARRCGRTETLFVHFANCAACWRTYEQEGALKTEIHNLGTRLTAPAEFHKKILTNHGMPQTKQDLSQAFRLLGHRAFGFIGARADLLDIIRPQPHKA